MAMKRASQIAAFALGLFWMATGAVKPLASQESVSQEHLGLEDAIAQSDSSPNLTSVLQYTPPRDLDAPRGRKHTSGRDNCPEVKKPLIALVPERYVALTTDAYPTFWYYIPYAATDVQSATLVVWNERQAKVSESTFPVEHTPGIVSIRLPQSPSASDSALAVDKRYDVDFSLTCKTAGTGSGSQPGVRIRVKRVTPDPDLGRQIAAARTPRQRYFLYAGHSLWLDALTELANRRRKKPRNRKIAADWQHLLNDSDVLLEEVASEELVSCCSLD